MFHFKDKKLLLAIAAIALIWGTTFLGIRVAVETIPPWFVAGIRQCIAALILLAVLVYRKDLKLLGKRELFTQFILSALMLVGANGLTTVAEKSLSSSLASLISSSSPILVFLLGSVFGMQKFSLKALSGVMLGFCGILLIFWDGLAQMGSREFRVGIITMMFAVVGWASGTIYSKTIHKKQQNLFLNLFYQFAFAGVVQMVLAIAFESNTDISRWTARSWAAVFYLGIFGSVLAYFAFSYALKTLVPTQISMLSYVNTIVAIFLGWLILDEKITWQFLVAAAMIITGVLVTNRSMGILK